MRSRKENGGKGGAVGKTTALAQLKPRKMPEGKSTRARINEPGPEVASIAKRDKMREGKMKKSK